MFLSTNRDLFDDRPPLATVQPWKPVALARDEWSDRDYRGVYAWRIATLGKLRNDSELLASARAYYADNSAEFIMHWMDTYDPRLKGSKWVPFVLFERQLEFIDFLNALISDEENGLVEKSRDMGATWLACAWTVWRWAFHGDTAIGWGSRKQELVDKLGDVSSIFEKMRMLVLRLPDIWRPVSYDGNFMKLINRDNGSTVTGESGDNIGRGGRSTAYIKDEAAYYERPEKIEAALGDNTNVQVDISSVNGLGNVFHRRAESAIEWKPGAVIPAGQTRKFIFDWRDHPEKDQAWYDERRAKAEREGMLHIFAQEVDRNYAAAVLNTIISYEWIVAATDAHLVIPQMRIPPPNVWSAGLDVADGGMDRNALALRQWVILRSVDEWGDRDPGVSTRRALAAVAAHRGIKIQADLIGVGSGVKTEYNRLCDDGLMSRDVAQLVFWNAGGAVVDPYDNIIPGDDESPLNRDFYQNFKAQSWWSLRARFYKTWRIVTAMRNGTDVPFYPADELISIDGSMDGLDSVQKELAQPVSKPSTSLKTMIDKAPAGTRSPNKADAVVMAFNPAAEEGGPLVGSYRG